MNKQEVLRICLRQPCAHYRVGFTQQHLHRTLPLPPPSTIIGMIHNILGCKRGEVIRGFDIAVHGNYESVFFQYQLFRNIEKAGKPAYKEANPWEARPNQVQLLNNVNLKIYIRFADDFTAINKISRDDVIAGFKEPQMPFIIGRREDLAVPEENGIEMIAIEEKELPVKLEYNHWLNQDTARRYNLNGPLYLLGTYYKLLDRVRNFERRRFVYAEKQPIEPFKEGNRCVDPVGWMDNDTPLFFLEISGKET